MIKYDLPDTSVHLGINLVQSSNEPIYSIINIIVGTTNPKEEPSESFMGVSDEDRKIPFFDKVDKFIHKMQEESIDRGFIKTPMGRKIPIGWIEQPTRTKVLQLSFTSIRNRIQYRSDEKVKG